VKGCEDLGEGSIHFSSIGAGEPLQTLLSLKQVGRDVGKGILGCEGTVWAETLSCVWGLPRKQDSLGGKTMINPLLTRAEKSGVSRGTGTPNAPTQTPP